MVTAVSPNVVVTVMLKLKEEKLGMNKGIHTLIYAMTTCNDVVSIFVFGVILGVVFSTGEQNYIIYSSSLVRLIFSVLLLCFQGSLSEQLLQGPVGIGIGVVFGFLYGLAIVVLPSKRSVCQRSIINFRYYENCLNIVLRKDIILYVIQWK